LACIICALIITSIVEFSVNDKFILTSSSIDNYDYDINDDNFLNNIEKIHNNIDENIGKTIKVSGFVYTMPDFNENFFICGRYIELDNETQVAGYLCNYVGKTTLEENEWIEVTGSIIKGDYDGEIPVIKVNTITKIPAPANMYISNEKNT
jgi:putative membrane protein